MLPRDAKWTTATDQRELWKRAGGQAGEAKHFVRGSVYPSAVRATCEGSAVNTVYLCGSLPPGRDDEIIPFQCKLLDPYAFTRFLFKF